MDKHHLCAKCARRFFAEGKGKGAQPSEDAGKECFICSGTLSLIPHLLASALSQSKGFEWETFSVATSFPRGVLIREAEVAAGFLPGGFTSIKNEVNAHLSAELAGASGKKNSQRSADAVFEFDFGRSKSFARPLPIYIHGHYLKLARNFCQSRWHCSECEGKGCDSCGGSGMNYPSVEDELGKILAPAFGASGCTLHASGREDVDVRCLGTGRPFVMELTSPKKRSADLRALEREFKKNENVQAIGLRLVHKAFIDSVCNSHFEKEYEAIVSADRALTSADAKKVAALSGTALGQQTPQRVLARRADLLRKRTVYKISADAVPGGKLKLRILAEAGTYIKEFIHSDEGRTTPSVSSTLKCRAQCDSLDVVAIHDYFLQTLKD